MKSRHSIAAALLLVSANVLAAPVHYDLDPSHTHVFISWTHLGFSHPGARFDKIEGDFDFDAADPTRSSITVTIPVSSLDTGVPALDEHLQTAQFFDAAKYPTAVFKSTRVERAGGHDFKVSGELTIHGVTKPQVLEVTINKVGPHPMGGIAAGFDAKTVIKRSDFGMGYGIPNVGDDITVDITAEAHPAKAAPASK